MVEKSRESLSNGTARELQQELINLLNACDISWPYLEDVQRIHDMLTTHNIEIDNDLPPALRSFLSRFPERPSCPQEISESIRVDDLFLLFGRETD